MESWLVVRCPKCQKKNWIYNGDPSDMTFFESEGVKCWNCGTCWKMSTDEDEDADEDAEEDDPRYELGQDFQEVKHEEKEASNDEE